MSKKVNYLIMLVIFFIISSQLFGMEENEEISKFELNIGRLEIDALGRIVSHKEKFIKAIDLYNALHKALLEFIVSIDEETHLKKYLNFMELGKARKREYFKSYTQRGSDLLLDQALIIAVHRDESLMAYFLYDLGALLFRERDSRECDVLIDAILLNRNASIKIIFKLWKKMVRDYPEFYENEDLLTLASPSSEVTYRGRTKREQKDPVFIYAIRRGNPQVVEVFFKYGWKFGLNFVVQLFDFDSNLAPSNAFVSAMKLAYNKDLRKIVRKNFDEVIGQLIVIIQRS